MVGEDPEKPVIDGRKADALLAAHYASEAALRLVKPGNEVTFKSINATMDIANFQKKRFCQNI